ncbi:MAG: ABC transporter substrate-binding protein [Sphingomonadales bacterium]
MLGFFQFCRFRIELCAIAAFLFIAAPVQAQSQSETTPAQSETTPAQSPSEVIETLHEALITAMRQAQELGYDGRYELLEPTVVAAFDTFTMARVATGRGRWKKLSADQRKALRDAFTQMTVAGYAGRFNDYSGQHFEILDQQPAKRGRILLKTQLIKANGEPVAFNYLMRRKDRGWVILDIYLDGTFSELAVRRSEFGAVLKDKGYDGLLAAIAKTIAKYREG